MKRIIGIICFTVIIGFGFLTCDNNDLSKGTVHKGKDIAGNEYILTIYSSARNISAGDDYEFIIMNEEGDIIGVTSGEINNVLDNTYTLSDDVDVVIDGTEISSVVGEITLKDGTTFIVRTFPVVYLRANRWEGLHEGVKNWGEHYNTGYSIILDDIYSDSLDVFFPAGKNTMKLKVSGNASKEIKNFGVVLLYVWEHNPWEGAAIAGTASDTYKNIGPGDFEVEIDIIRWEERLISEFPDNGIVYVDFDNQLFNKKEGYPFHGHDYNEIIPDDMPNGAIYASIRNFTIEPVIE